MGEDDFENAPTTPASAGADKGKSQGSFECGGVIRSKDGGDMGGEEVKDLGPWDYLGIMAATEANRKVQEALNALARLNPGDRLNLSDKDLECVQKVERAILQQDGQLQECLADASPKALKVVANDLKKAGIAIESTDDGTVKFRFDDTTVSIPRKGPPTAEQIVSQITDSGDVPVGSGPRNVDDALRAMRKRLFDYLAKAP